MKTKKNLKSSNLTQMLSHCGDVFSQYRSQLNFKRFLRGLLSEHLFNPVLFWLSQIYFQSASNSLLRPLITPLCYQTKFIGEVQGSRMSLIGSGSKIDDIQQSSRSWPFFKFRYILFHHHWYTAGHHLTLIEHLRASHSNLNLKANLVLFVF